MNSATREEPLSDFTALPQSLRFPALCLLISVVTFLLSTLGLSVLSDQAGVAAVWPANGVAVAALLLLSRPRWFAVLASSYVGNVLANLVADRALVTALVHSGVDAAEVLAAGSVMRLVVPHTVRFETTREVILFVVFACGGSAIVGGVLGALSVHTMAGITDSFLGVWLFWAVVDALGMITVAPLLVTAICHRPVVRSTIGLLEKAICLSLFTVVVLVIYGAVSWRSVLLLNMPYVALLPFLVWAGLRLDIRVSSLMTLILVTVGAWSTLRGQGPFVVAGFDENSQVIAFEISAILWGMSALSLSAVTTERRVAAAALHASEIRARAAEREAIEGKERIQAFFDHAEVLIYMKDREGRFIAVNRAFERVLNVQPSEVLGRRDVDVFPEDMARRFHETDAIVLREGRTLSYEVESNLEAASGVFWSVKFPIRDASGNVTAVCGMTTDITARKQIERDLQVAKQAAEENARRSEALAVKAEAANRAKTEFLANISHEIRTPLTAILGYCDLLLAPSLTEDQRIHHTETIRRNGEHLLAILNDVLDMSRIEAGRMTIERVMTNLPDIVAEVMAFVEHRAVEQGIALSADCRTPIPKWILSDPTRLRQILMNLVGNAVKFTRHGSVRIVVAVEQASAGEMLVVEVVDTGIGMAPHQVDVLGKPFMQGDPSHGRRFGGSGLGLSICHRLAQLMGGSIACVSQEGVGSTFTLRLPIGDTSGWPRVGHLAVLQASPIESPSARVGPRLTGRMLIAEDAPDTRRLLVAYLRQTGVEVHTVDNGEAAVAQAVAAWQSGQPFDLIVMDVQMPQMDGVTATTSLRSQGYTGPIIALTANAMEQDRTRCLAAGCDGFLIKPIRADAFVGAVGRFMRKGQDAVPPEASLGPPGQVSGD